ncbi:hypothetical protein L3Q67_45400 (plasmid) [Saccharothrix sp. AJ9571]|nr:hypothetical protein L3Q67_45400 [Saccharothrix sp. AJ9571]
MLNPLDVSERLALVDRLRRFAADDEFVSAHGGAALDLLCTAVAADRAGQPRRDNVTTDDIHGGLGLIASERARLDEAEVSLIEAALDRGESLPELARVYDMTRQALTKRYYALGGTRTPLTGLAGDVTPHGAVLRYWMARTEADVHSEAATEVPLYYNGTKFRPEVPASIGGDSGAAYLGDLPGPGATISGRVYRSSDSTNPINVWLRAEPDPATET